MTWNDRHGWKWIGAPQSGVLALFASQPAAPLDSHNPKLHHAPSPATNNPLEATPSDVNALPRALRLVLLGVEIVLSLATGLLCVWCASVVRSLVRAIVRSPPVLSECVYTAVVAYGLVAFFARIFHPQQHHSYALVLKRLGLFWTPLAALAGSLVLHSSCLLLVRGVPPTSSLAASDTLSLRSVLLAPLEEELFFRALVGHLALHRLRGHQLASAAVSSAGFALVHLANVRRIPSGDDTHGGLFVQIMWALVVGVFLALRYTRKGSLLECVLLHAINNVFAAVASASVWSEPEKTLVGILSIVAYALASLREWHAYA